MTPIFSSSKNDVLDFSQYFKGKDEPPLFRKQFIDLKDKIFIPVDDLDLLSLCRNSEENAILHHFVRDNKQNKFVTRKIPPINLYQKCYAVTSSDLSVDSKRTFSVFNLSNILKARIFASRLQNEYGLLTILTLIWGDSSTYDMSFSNVEKGTVCAVSSQGVEDIEVFKEGFIRCIHEIQPEYLCWYGRIYDWVDQYYDLHRIIKMQTRTQLIQKKIRQQKNTGQYLFITA